MKHKAADLLECSQDHVEKRSQMEISPALPNAPLSGGLPGKVFADSAHSY